MKIKYSPIIIIGMHRSGTSAFTKGLQNLGVDIGRRLDSNYEDIFFQKLNKFMLNQIGCDWDNPFNINIALKNKFMMKALTNYLKSELKNFNRNSLWGFKDPRTTLFLNIWSQIFKKGRFIIIKRDQNEIFKSLTTRNSMKYNSKMFSNNNVKMIIKKKLNFRIYPGVSPLCDNKDYAKKLIKFYNSCINHFEKKNFDRGSINYSELTSKNSSEAIHRAIRKINLKFNIQEIKTAFNHLKINENDK